jgi:HSP20 family protein
MTKCNVPTFRSPLNNLFDSFFSDALPEAYPGCHCPATDIQETAQSFVIALDLPGVAESDIQIEALDRNLKIRAERKDAPQQDGTRLHRKEQRRGAFERTFLLPDTADTTRIDAKLELGVLTVTVQKIEKPQPKRIQIRTQG